MNFSVSQWLSMIVLDFFIKFLLVEAVGLFVSYGLIPIGSFAPAAISLSLLHFVCLFLGATLVVTPELFGVRLSPMPRFAAGVTLANILFVGVLTVLFWPGPNDIPRTADGPIIVALVLSATNLFSLFTVAATGCLIRRRKAGVRVDRSTCDA
ncbi:hypothetical protein [uncultured Bradyrhizobium sp.]|jgi:hypothetical protein|uniref:hypothetical protein n=1 Tax=uncultured Bradyrhizobium sp. TaxID=199684 RepID=UPI002607A4FC|nr:hypothetical protein [uncultured Bradyrhizobium sp.]